jgi:hypothetical protein
VAGLFREDGQHAKWLRLEAHQLAAPAQATRADVQFEVVECQAGGCHGGD